MRERLIAGAALVLLAAGVVGWFANTWKLAHMALDEPGMLILRAFGLFVPPLGGVLGWL